VEAVILWCGVNAIIGYLIGKAKNEVGGAIVLSILLGPIGWLIAALRRGHLRKCPFCAEQVKPEATVCKHCGSKLPPPTYERMGDHPQIGSRPKANQKPTTEAATGGGRKSKAVTVIGVIIMLAILAIAVLYYYKNRETDVASGNLEEAAHKADAYLRVSHASHSSYASDTPMPAPQPELRGMSVMRLVRIKTPDGELIIPKGTPVRVINEESSPGTTLINYDGYTVPVPSAILGPVPN
jgi:hypothetical protein